MADDTEEHLETCTNATASTGAGRRFCYSSKYS